MLRCLPVVMLLGCGTLLRVEAGPTWIGDGPGGTVQASAGFAPVAGSGLFNLWLIGGYGTATASGFDGGLFAGCDFGVAPGGVDESREACHVPATCSGHHALKFEVGPDGHVLRANVVESTVADPEVGTCIAAKARRWQFPTPRGGGIVAVRYPFIFRRS